MAQPFEEQYEDILHDIEFAILKTYQAQPEMTDFNVEKLLNTLIREYQDEQTKRTPLTPNFVSDLDKELYDKVKVVCEWWAGREPKEDGAVQEEPNSLEEVLACLKRIRLSHKRWNKEGGRRGYLSFIQEYVK